MPHSHLYTFCLSRVSNVLVATVWVCELLFFCLEYLVLLIQLCWIFLLFALPAPYFAFKASKLCKASVTAFLGCWFSFWGILGGWDALNALCVCHCVYVCVFMGSFALNFICNWIWDYFSFLLAHLTHTHTGAVSKGHKWLEWVHGRNWEPKVGDGGWWSGGVSGMKK